MSTKGIRILDIKDGKCIPLFELLANIPNAEELNWALLWLDVTPIKKEGGMITELQQKSNKSKKGFICKIGTLIEISKKIHQEIELLIIGSKLKKHLHRYKEDQEMYEACDIVLEMIDGGFWEIFSKNTKWIDQLALKYNYTEFLKTDFQKN